MKDNKIKENIRTLAINKRLNFLIGAGTSSPAISPKLDLNSVKKVSEYLIYSKNKEEKFNLSDDQIEQINNKSEEYKGFIEVIIRLLRMSNSRQSPKSVNIFSTNYDLFIEEAVDNILMKNMKLVFNDGANGYFHRYLNSYNFDKATSYRGQFEMYNDEIPSISLIKPHGSINWEQSGKKILIHNKVCDNPMVITPDGKESVNTFANNHFFAMLRLFQEELNKSESILIVFGFSFNDEHIMNMVSRALQNPSLIVYVFAHSDKAAEKIKSNFHYMSHPQLNIVRPEDILSLGKDAEIRDKKFEFSHLINLLNNK